MNRNYTFKRFQRTTDSEGWFVNLNDESVGKINLHFGRDKYIDGDIILVDEFEEEIINEIIKETESRLVEHIFPREDFAYYVHIAKKSEFYSDIVNHDFSSPTKKDLKEQKILLETVLNKYQFTRGQLKEHVVIEYFENLNFKSKKAPPQLDAKKVDVIAEKANEKIYCQVKLGKLSEKSINKIVAYLAKIEGDDKKKIKLAVVADSFPINIEEIKTSLVAKYEKEIWIITKDHILKSLPAYKRSLQ